MSEDKKLTLEEVGNLFSRDYVPTQKDVKNDENIGNAFLGVSHFFAQPRKNDKKEQEEQLERRKEWNRKRVDNEVIKLSGNIQGILLNKYSCVAKDIMPILSCDTVLRKRLVEFLNNYMARITNITNQEGVFSFTSLENCDEIKSAIEKLKSYCDDVESAIRLEYEKHFNKLYDDEDEEFVLEAKQREVATKAERDLLILQYKTLFYEYIVYLENKCETLRKFPRPKFPGTSDK